MTGRAITYLLLAVLGAAICCVGGLIGFTGAASACTPGVGPSASAPATTVAGYDAEQISNAATIITTGVGRGIPVRGLIIAVATAIQESSLHNYGDLGQANDHDSLGLFQQRPSQGWGTPEQIMDPVYASNRFFDKLLSIAGWEQMPLTQAAQRVQVSAYPNAYAKHEGDATAIVAHALAAGAGICIAGEWTQPVHAPIVSGFRTPQRPTHNGTDLGAGRGTTIVAASAGKVIRVRCNAIDRRDGSDWGCDRDGDPDLTLGCGWYVDVLHAGNILTRYCHMNAPPYVEPGDLVVAGQPLGVVGSTGHSSGPHLHFEVRLGADENTSGEPTDAEMFMNAVSAPLGQ